MLRFFFRLAFLATRLVAFAAVVFGVDLIKMPDATRGIDFALVFGP